MNEFWLVWSPQGLTAPRYRHASFEAAKAEAERLSARNMYAEFYVLRAISRSKALTVETTLLNDGLPF